MNETCQLDSLAEVVTLGPFNGLMNAREGTKEAIRTERAITRLPGLACIFKASLADMA